jgi:hypothetical protein
MVATTAADIETGRPIPRELVYLWLTNSSVLFWIATPLYKRKKPVVLDVNFHNDVWLLLTAKIGQIADRFVNIYTFWYVHLLTLTMIAFRRTFSFLQVGVWGGLLGTIIPLLCSICITACISARNQKVALEIQRCRDELVPTVMIQGYALTVEAVKPRNCLVQQNYVLVLRPVEAPSTPRGSPLYPNECIVTIEGFLGLIAALAASILVRHYV